MINNKEAIKRLEKAKNQNIGNEAKKLIEDKINVLKGQKTITK